ncbi:MAG TPA: histidine phosphatase family protein [Pyrinomonadaceae bacterium]|jgi:phosphohistidine phosphatase
MKTIHLLRHAKSSWKDPGQSDFERPLNGRGREAAPLVGQFMLQKKVRPNLILSSPAERARQTAALVIKAANLDAELRFDERIYEADAARLLEVVSQIDEAAGVALLVGHNPGMEDLLTTLTGERHAMPTAALARIILDVEKWGKVREGAGRLDWLVRVKDLIDT